MLIHLEKNEQESHDMFFLLINAKKLEREEGHVPRRDRAAAMDWVSVASALLAFLLYYNTLDAGFVYDDR
ncbi:hypothetical protein EVAR_61582_1 [Eumeta japonica]|uniref:Uncharacterized protein n=1 Tax=Eumeta variegata TaxID=151549 RepID=A0A4C1YQ43_EUMVA|nr:hypothetical protein EVAR_61582_1 [Eumeta japonica]